MFYQWLSKLEEGILSVYSQFRYLLWYLRIQSLDSYLYLFFNWLNINLVLIEMEKIDDKVEDEAEGTDCINVVVGFIIKYSKFNEMQPIFWVSYQWHCWPNHQGFFFFWNKMIMCLFSSFINRKRKKQLESGPKFGFSVLSLLYFRVISVLFIICTFPFSLFVTVKMVQVATQ